MYKYSYCFLLSLLLLSSGALAQEEDLAVVATSLPQSGVGYGLKGGLTIGTQKWNNVERNALISYHGDLFVEFMGAWKSNRDDGKGGRRTSFGLNLGYHRKGSAIWGSYIDQNNNFRTFYVPNVFHNISLGANAKAAFQMNQFAAFYGAFGLRLEYTATYNMPSIVGLDNFVKRLGYGLWIGGGVEFALPKLPMSMILEVSIAPDISRQIYVPPGIPYVYYDAAGNQQTYPSQEQKVVNLVFEISAGFRIDPPRR